MYGSRAADAPLADLAFLGRVPDEDLQDATLSIPRQLANCEAALLPGPRIVAHYWDVESDRIDPDRRGRSKAYQRFDVPVPRDEASASCSTSPYPPLDLRRGHLPVD
jgi:site-specific DNA recombinase